MSGVADPNYNNSDQDPRFYKSDPDPNLDVKLPNKICLLSKLFIDTLSSFFSSKTLEDTVLVLLISNKQCCGSGRTYFRIQL